MFVFVLFCLFPPYCYKKEKGKNARVCVSEREKKSSPRKVSFCLYPRIWILGPTGMSSHKFSTEAHAEYIIRWREGAFGSQGGRAGRAVRSKPGQHQRHGE